MQAATPYASTMALIATHRLSSAAAAAAGTEIVREVKEFTRANRQAGTGFDMRAQKKAEEYWIKLARNQMLQINTAAPVDVPKSGKVQREAN